MTDSSFFEATRPHDKGYADNKCADRRCRNRTGSCDHFYTPCDFAARRGRRPATGHKSVPGILSRLEPAQALTRTRSLGQQCYNKSSLSDLSHAVDASPARDQPGSAVSKVSLGTTVPTSTITVNVTILHDGSFQHRVAIFATLLFTRTRNAWD
ncbi:uncharacterized protein LOC111271937 isoform X2 [Varroa jacobsoni]|uniref:uncharacterized protein LOC111271937 isoform X2 n=1 Tax=Varroa jacobsoni TaxID=62625 RepID=UPI000BF9AB2C|nr:uncharacterized protein LOC111271937 isoform X2 [Varroa jacobsoni]